MSPLSNVLFVLSYGMMAVGVAAMCYFFIGVSVPVACLMGGAVFLFCAQIHGLVGRARERSALENELVNLHRAHRIIGDELEQTRRRMADATNASEAKAVVRNNEIICEVRILETFVQQLSDNIRTKAIEKLQHVVDESRQGSVSQQTATGPRSTRIVSDSIAIFDQISESELIEIVRRSLQENKVDLYLQPIVSLPQRKLRFYEGLPRLRTLEGNVLEPSKYREIAASIGLIGLVDNLLLFKSIQMIRDLATARKDTLIFCNISVYTLMDQAFFPQLLDYLQHSADLSNSVIFELGQDVFEQCGPLEKVNLQRLAELGYGFSMDNVNTLDLNFAELRDRRFRYVKVQPELILSAFPDEQDDFETIRIQAVGADVGMSSSNVIEDITVIDSDFDGNEPEDIEQEEADNSELSTGSELSLAEPEDRAGDFKEILARYGLDLIVEKIETEDDVLDVMRINVDYGQGSLFGAPQPVGPSETVDSLLPSPEPDQRHEARGRQSLDKTGIA